VPFDRPVQFNKLTPDRREGRSSAFGARDRALVTNGYPPASDADQGECRRAVTVTSRRLSYVKKVSPGMRKHAWD
jgi:hypothetical protein